VLQIAAVEAALENPQASDVKADPQAALAKVGGTAKKDDSKKDDAKPADKPAAK
jgi:hypothetical protein